MRNARGTKGILPIIGNRGGPEKEWFRFLARESAAILNVESFLTELSYSYIVLALKESHY